MIKVQILACDNNFYLVLCIIDLARLGKSPELALPPSCNGTEILSIFVFNSINPISDITFPYAKGKEKEGCRIPRNPNLEIHTYYGTYSTTQPQTATRLLLQ